MTVPILSPGRTAQAGFTMVEMLMTALILAVGIMGLTMLQVMSMRASGGSARLTVAVQVAERIMDQVELEGRLSWLEKSNPQGAVANLSQRYLGHATSTVAVNDYFDPSGKSVAAGSAFFRAATLDLADLASTNGATSDIQVRVDFEDTVNKNGVKVPRNVTITRRILHG